MKIGGLQKLTLIDYPQKLACTLFLSGCSFRCPWCYAPELVLPEKIKNHLEIKEEDFFNFLEKRRGKLEGVVVCGGEPTLSNDLSDFLKKIKEKGFSVKLDTNGFKAEVIENLLKEKLIDYIAMDIKGPLEKYKEIVKAEVDVREIEKSIVLIKKAKIPYEFRTTLVPGVHAKEDIFKMAEMIEGAQRYFLQNFLAEKTLEDDFLGKKPFSLEELNKFKEVADPFVKKCVIR